MRLLRLGVRARTTLIATLAVAVVLTGAGALLVAATRSALRQAVETTVTARSADVASQLPTGGIPDRIPFIGGISVQIVGGSSVLASTQDIEGQVPILSTPSDVPSPYPVFVSSLDADEENVGERSGDEGDDGPYLVAATGAVVGGSPVVVLAAGSLRSVTSATRALVPLLALGIPVTTLLVALVVWRLTGRAFRPVTAMARKAESISFSDLHLRIPEPEPDDEIRHLALVLNRMLTRLQESAARQRRFVADAGHELKSPVASLLTMAEVAEANPSKFAVSELAGDVAEQSRRLASLVEDLLVLARSSESGLILEPEPLDLAEVVKAAISTSRSESAHIDASHLDEAPVRGDRRRLGQVVGNLLDNAALHARGEVAVETRAEGDHVLLVVSDDGPGIPVEDRERIFERFVRLDEARSRSAGGTGLGLSVVKSIVEAHGGTIEVGGSEALGGARFTVRLQALR